MTAVTVASEPDPIFGLIEAVHRMRFEYNEVFDGEDEQEEARLWGAFCDAEEKLHSTRPVTLAGLRAKLDYIRWYVHHDAAQFATPSFTLELLDNLLPSSMT